MKANFNASLGIEGRYRLLIGVPGEVPRVDMEFKNIILDVGLNAIGTNLSGGYLRSASLGTGTAAAAGTDTGLQIPGVTSTIKGDSEPSSRGFVSGPPPYSWSRWALIFAQGVATGTWSEVGVGNATTMWSRAIIVDGGGTPTPITVLAIEQLTVEYELRLYPSIVDVTGTVNDGATNHNFTLRPWLLTTGNTYWYADYLVNGALMGGGYLGGSYKFNAYTGTIGAYTGAPSGAASVGDSGQCSVASYSSTTYKKTQTATAAIGAANVVGGIKSVVFASLANNGFGYQAEFDPVISKDNTKTLAFTFSIVWARRP